MSLHLALVLAAAVAVAPAAAQSDARLDAAMRASAETLVYRIPGTAPRLGAEAHLPAATAALPADSLRPPDAWLGRDKALHFGASFLLTLSGQYVLTDKGNLSNAEALPFSAGVALGLGVAKEVADSRRAVGPHFSLRDLAVDALGVAVGVLVTRL